MRTARSMDLVLAVSLALAASSCSNGSPGTSAGPRDVPVSAAPPETARATAEALAPASAPTAPAPTASTEAPPALVTTGPAPAASAASAGSARASGKAIEVKNIGMHIGGGPNDEPTKAPIKQSVAPHLGEFAACAESVADFPPKGGDVSVDLRIEAEGGKADLRKYKSAIKGEAFEKCVRDVFAAIDFKKPKKGATVVSYSLRFTPAK